MCVFSSLDLNSLNLPHADDSDASEKENEDGRQETETTGQGLSGGLVCSLQSKSAISTATTPPPPPPPPSPPPFSRLTDDPRSQHNSTENNRNFGQLADAWTTNGQSENGGPWEPLESVGLSHSFAYHKILMLILSTLLSDLHRLNCEDLFYNRTTSINHSLEY